MFSGLALLASLKSAGALLSDLPLKLIAIVCGVILALLLIFLGWSYVNSLQANLIDVSAKLAVEKIETSVAKSTITQMNVDIALRQHLADIYAKANAATQVDLDALATSSTSVSMKDGHVSDEDLRTLNDAVAAADRVFDAAGR